MYANFLVVVLCMLKFSVPRFIATHKSNEGQWAAGDTYRRKKWREWKILTLALG